MGVRVSVLVGVGVFVRVGVTGLAVGEGVIKAIVRKCSSACVRIASVMADTGSFNSACQSFTASLMAPRPSLERARQYKAMAFS